MDETKREREPSFPDLVERMARAQQAGLSHEGKRAASVVLDEVEIAVRKLIAEAAPVIEQTWPASLRMRVYGALLELTNTINALRIKVGRPQ